MSNVQDHGTRGIEYLTGWAEKYRNSIAHQWLTTFKETSVQPLDKMAIDDLVFSDGSFWYRNHHFFPKLKGEI
jgi:hypothetical protein